MFGLTFEKLFLVALLAAVIVGPRRLPDYVGRAAMLLRRATAFVADARHRAEEETGVAVLREDWRALDPRQYDPRRIIREAWADAEAGAVPWGSEADEAGASDAETDARGGMSDVLDTVTSTHSFEEGSAIERAVVMTEEDDVSERGGVAKSGAREGRWIVSGTSAHPRRVWVPAEE
ncbi:twin-arginine translocase TatA/TatE family subunit [Microbacterium sp. ZW T5_45]|uniref:Sec-independent protein translocase subunit TatA/TatB n=1 Tax=Microbacterium sp. ZW T5_45 TaxID=3378080 RepID=UPI0038527133